MKKIIMLIAITLVSTCCFANTGFSKNSSQLNALSSAWKSHHTIQPDQNDITIVYGGQDVSHKPILNESTAVA